MAALLSGLHRLDDMMECADLARSSYHYAPSRPKGPTRPELREDVAEIFSRTANGCGHRQIAMCLRAEKGAVIADKTVLRPRRLRGPLEHEEAPGQAEGTDPGGVPEAVPCGVVFI